MDPLSAIGVAASVVQFTNLAFKVATRLKEYNSASTDVPKSLRHISAQLPLLLNALDRVKTSIEVERVDLDTRCILKGVVSGCKQQVEKIDKIIDKVLPVPGDSLVTRAQKVFIGLKNDDKVLEIEKSLQTYIQVLILHRVIEGQDDSWVINEDLGFFEVRVKKATPFFERKELMQKIETIINPAVTSQALSPIRIILSGNKGAGKTQLAAEYCHQANVDGQFQTIFWTNASTPESLCRSLEGISDVIRRSKEGLKDRDEKIEFVKSFLCNRWHPWLLVLDNFVPSEFKNDIHYLPSKGSGAILFTSRSRSFPDPDKVMEVPQFFHPDEIERLRSAMIFAVDNNKIDNVKKLLADGADPNCQGLDLRPCLHRAVDKTYTNMVKLLLMHGASSRLDGFYGPQALYRAGNIDIIRILLDHEDAAGLTPKAPGNNDALLTAASKGHEDIIRILIEHGSVDVAFKSEDGATALGTAAENGRTAVVKMLLAYGADANDKSKGEAPLTWATRGYHLETVKVLCTEGKAQVNVADFTFDSSQPPLWHAVCPSFGHRRSDDMVKYLLESGADAKVWNKRNSSPLQEAARRGLRNAARMLLDYGADAYPTEGKGYPPIVEGAKSGSESVVKLLLGAKATDITARDRQREQALINASIRGNRDVIVLLLEEGVDIDTEGDYGKTPLIFAIDEKQIPTARLLIRCGAREDKSDEDGRLPLFMAAEKGLDVVVKEIVKKTKNRDVQNAKGDTALCVAAAKGHEEVVKFLLDSNADRDLANKFGDTPLDLAVEGHHKKIAEMLEQPAAGHR
ncbi:hypothetical protein OEA41_007573 [Lepraria neglecta]|uniref:Ankyrin n=1 Tax=Lepraria neglecta TaxID=209136 RepID=A0AAE0DQJ9_9LECA|nr:hypothetical protein OEA41_007573 [Lepraria neglecta]